MARRSQFPKAKPTKAERLGPRIRRPKHVFVWDASSDWRGQPFCQLCDQPRNNPVHDLGPTDPEAKAIDERKLGEGR